MDRNLPLRVLTIDRILRRAALAGSDALPQGQVAAASQHRDGAITVWTAYGASGLRLTDLFGWNHAFAETGPLALDFDSAAAVPDTWSRIFGRAIRCGIVYPVRDTAGLRAALLLTGTVRSDDLRAGDPLGLLDALALRTADLLRLSCVLEAQSRTPRPARPARYESLRKRLARELHDGIGQPMSGLLVRVQTAKQRGFAAIDDLQAFEHAAHETIEAARLVADGLRSAVPTFGHLASARRYAEAILGAAGCKLQWVDGGGTRSIEPRVARELAAVVKESVTNVVRHAHALEVAVRLEQRDGHLCLEIADDGVGVAETGRRSGGLGLVGNAERAERLGGHFAIQQGPDGGTLVTFTIPHDPVAHETTKPVCPVAPEASTASLVAS
jgi:signal transduction histidine kinase